MLHRTSKVVELAQVCRINTQGELHRVGDQHPIPARELTEIAVQLKVSTGDFREALKKAILLVPFQRQISDLANRCRIAKDGSIFLRGASNPLRKKDWDTMAAQMGMPSELCQNEVTARVIGIATQQQHAAVDYGQLKEIMRRIGIYTGAHGPTIDGKSIDPLVYADICTELFGRYDSFLVQQVKQDVHRLAEKKKDVQGQEKRERKAQQRQQLKELETRFTEMLARYVYYRLTNNGPLLAIAYPYVACNGEVTGATVSILGVIRNIKQADHLIHLISHRPLVEPLAHAMQTIPAEADANTAALAAIERQVGEFYSEYEMLVEDDKPAVEWAHGVLAAAVAQSKLRVLPPLVSVGWEGYAYLMMDRVYFATFRSSDAGTLALSCPTWIGWLRTNGIGHVTGGALRPTSTEAFCFWIYLMFNGMIDNMRQAFLIRGAGKTGNSRVGNALLHIFGNCGTSFTPTRDAGAHTTHDYVGKCFAVYAETDETRAVAQAAIKKVLGADKARINPKYEATYQATVHMVMLIVGNKPMYVNIFDRSETTRYLMMETKPRTVFDPDAEAKYVSEFYAFLAYCEKIYWKYNTEITPDIEIPQDMAELIRTKCATEGSALVRNLFDNVKYDSSNKWVSLAQLARIIHTWSGDDTPNLDREIRAALQQAEISLAIPLEKIISNAGRIMYRLPERPDEKLIEATINAEELERLRENTALASKVITDEDPFYFKW